MKIKLTILTVCLILAGVLLINACRKSGRRSAPPATSYDFVIPPGFPAPVVDLSNNPLTNEGVALGRKLFYEPRVSADDKTPCASCHQQIAAFTTYDHDLSHGVFKQHTARNAPGLFNKAWQGSFQQDGAITDLLQQPIVHFTAPNEMGRNVDEIVNKLKDDADYKSMFLAAFGDENVNSTDLLKALEQFVYSMVSANSKYDKVKKGEAEFNVSEAAGYEIFKAKCTSCHSEPLFTDGSFRNDGFELNPEHNDYGRMMVTGNSADSLKFRVPSLRNVGATNYYVHDGRLEFLSEMLDHYNNGVIDGPTLDPLLKNGIPLSDLDKFYLGEFLLTLTDSAFINNPLLAKPE
ncbi:MAG TPA: cytochrome c peroxidase [Flavitalea sp.]|nr:cytochrome c peroxidase [Flavitalea sp.]